MKILIVTHYFPPEIGAPQARLSDFARMWADAGHEVTVLTGMPNHPTGVVPPQYHRRLRVIERSDGYRIVRTWLYATPNEGIVKKTLGHLSFMVSSVILGWRRVGRPDVVVVSSPTFFAIGSAWLIARTKRARFVVEVRDLWPAIFVQLGVLTNRYTIAVLERLELAAYRAADAVVVVTDGFRDHIAKRGIPESKIVTIRNGVDLDRFSPVSEVDSKTRFRLGASDSDVLVLYIGAHGISQGITSIVEAAAQLVDTNIHIALVGEGADKQRVLDRVSELGTSNVTCLPGVPRDQVAAVLAASDICLVPLRDVPLFSAFIPSKIFEILAAGRPIVGAVRGEPAAILQEAGAIVVVPEDPAALASAIRTLAANPAQRSSMSVQGRTYVSEHFDRRMLAQRYLDLIESVLAR